MPEQELDAKAVKHIREILHGHVYASGHAEVGDVEIAKPVDLRTVTRIFRFASEHGVSVTAEEQESDYLLMHVSGPHVAVDKVLTEWGY